ncbi:SDR family oxidoreductase [Ramlibacter henchirensis]|uniref:SDR family oxidoreductase n=1 Tax=Ramlibacter henchirensis TaxID=204072 RepID=A0A4Z0BUA5_9BURK|nr:SDR family oxidoreductase [Ramlibacter henchirensis]TFZ02883.1 SDR family oxidoreductase [Ramlibacter henchirensis]
MTTYENGVALVLGGTGHIGAGIVRLFAQQGVDVAFTYRREGKLVEELVGTAGGSSRVTAHQADLLQSGAAAGVLETLASQQRVHTVIHAAGIEVPQRYMSQVPREEWLHAVNMELTGFFDAMQAAVKVLRKGGGGSLVALTSSAIHRYAPKDGLSAIPKSAVEMMVRAVAKEEGRHGIRANCVAPGLIDGGIGRQVIEELGVPNFVSTAAAATPLKRLITAQDIAHMAAFLASREASGITGQTIVVDGGYSL